MLITLFHTYEDKFSHDTVYSVLSLGLHTGLCNLHALFNFALAGGTLTFYHNFAQKQRSAAFVAEWLGWLISLSSLIIRSSHRCSCSPTRIAYTWDKSSSACSCVRWFSRVTPLLRSTYRLACLDMSEIILKGTLN